MISRRYRLSLMFLVAALTSMRCANLAFDPNSGGGTDTGNPGMLACSRAVFDEVDSCGQWSPAAYLPGGEQQLNPTAYLSGTPKIPLGKTIATDTIAPDSGNILNIRFSVDTIILIDSVFVRDTVLKDLIIWDTLHPDAQTAVIVESKKVDSIIVIDTVVKNDTMLAPRLDTTFIQLVDSANAPITIVKDTIAGTTQIVYLNNGQPRIYTPITNVSYDLAAGQVSYFVMGRASAPMICITSNFSLKSDSGNVQMARTSAVSGTAVYEEYSDADGDGYLFKAAGWTSLRSKFLGIYASGGLRTTLTVVFDAGADRLFPTTADNRILSLSRMRSLDGKTVDKTTYTIPAVDSTLDSAILVRERYPETGAVLDVITRYRCITGQDGMNHRQNRLAAVTKHISFRNGTVRTLEVEITPDSPVNAFLPCCGSGLVTGRIYYGTIFAGTFDGRIDMASRTMSGVYTENGIAYHVTYSRSADNLSWGQSEQGK